LKEIGKCSDVQDNDFEMILIWSILLWWRWWWWWY